MQSQPVHATLPLAVTLEAQQWNAVIGALHEAPYRLAAPLIDAISTQLQSAAQLANAEPPPTERPRAGVLETGNGLDHTPPLPEEGGPPLQRRSRERP